jgi:hypothetical protein
MKANNKENKAFSDSIDKLSDGIDEIVELYNVLEEDIPLINFEKRVISDIEKAKKIYGDRYVDQKINTIVKEVLSWLDLDKVEEKEGGEAEE